MSKKRRSRKKMKPYQVKLRVIGIMSIIVSLLVLWLPLPSKAVNVAEKTNWQGEFDSKADDSGTEKYLDLIRYRSDPTSLPTTPSTPLDQDTVIVAQGEITIPEFAVILDPGPVQYYPRIGSDYSGGVFAGKTTLKKANLSNVFIQSSTTAKSLKELFSGCTALESVTFGDTAKISVGNTTDFTGMFRGCASLTEIINLENFKPTAVSDVSEMFAGCLALETVDLSGFSFSGLSAADSSKYAKVFEGCNNLQEIKTPTGIPSTVKINLPYSFRNADDSADTTDYRELPSVSSSIRLVRNNDVQSVTVTPSETTVETGKTVELTVTLDPLYAENGSGGTQSVTLKTSKNGIAEFKDDPGVTSVSSDKETATVTLTDGTAKVTLITKTNSGTKTDGTPDSLQIEATAKKNPNTSDPTTVFGLCDIVIQDKVVSVTGVSIDPKSGIIKKDTPIILKATISPTGATNQEIEWTFQNVNTSITDDLVKLKTISGDSVEVEVTEKGFGDVYVTVKTKDGGFTDYATITVTSPYEFKKVVDHRTDTSNQTLTTGTVSGQPTSSNAYLHIETDTDATKRAAIDSKLTGYAPKSCFNISKHNADTIGTGTSITDDLGTATITMALPGEFLTPSNASKQVKLYTYDGTNVQDISNAMVKTTVGTSGTIGAVRFAVSTADAELAKTYILALDPSATVTSTGFIFKVSDESTKTTPRATSGLPDKQTMDLYLVVDDSLGPVLKPLVNADATLTTYAQQYYYDVYLTDNNSLAKPTTPIDFGSIEITLPLPDGVDWQNGKLLLVSEHNGALDKQEVPKIVQNTSTGKECVQFTATHFSEHAILYDPATEYTITTTHTGGTTASTTAINGTDATAATAPAGADAAATVPIASTNTVTVTATPGDGYHFVRWTEGGAQVSTEASYTFNPTANRTLNAVFEANSTPTPGPTPTGPFRLTVDRLPTAGGTTATSPEQNAYNAGETVTVTATANTGYTFMYWADETGARLSSDASYQVTMDRDKRLYAVFAQEGEVAGAGRTMDAVVNVNIPDITIPAPQVTVGEPQVSVNIPAINVYADGASANAGTSGTFYPLAFTRPGNYADMPRTGTASMYRVMLTIILLMSGTVEVLLSIPAKKKRRVRTG